MKAQTLKVKVVFTIIHFGESGKILETKNTNEDNNDERETSRTLIIVLQVKLTFSMCHGLKAFFAGVRPANVIFSCYPETEEDYHHKI